MGLQLLQDRLGRHGVIAAILALLHGVIATVLKAAVAWSLPRDETFVFGAQVAVFGCCDFPASLLLSLATNDPSFWPGTCDATRFLVWLLVASLWWGLLGLLLSMAWFRLRSPRPRRGS
jgi:hypothetical protein